MRCWMVLCDFGRVGHGVCADMDMDALLMRHSEEHKPRRFLFGRLGSPDFTDMIPPSTSLGLRAGTRMTL